MEIFDIVGSVFGFLGSVIFAAALLKPSEQIRDENTSYWGKNPFTLKGELNNQPLFLIAFLLLVTGFSISLGGRLTSFLLGDNEVLIASLLSLSITLSGYLFTSLLFIKRMISHNKSKIEHSLKVFFSAATTYKRYMKEFIGTNNLEGFKKNKESNLVDLRKKADAVPEPATELARELIRELNKINNPEDFVATIDNYTSSNQLDGYDIF